MLHENLDSHELYKLLKGMFDSIREINRRIDELSLVIKNDWCTPGGKKEITSRVANLIESRLHLSTSIHTIRNHLVSSFGEQDQRELSGLFNRGDLYGQLRKL